VLAEISSLVKCGVEIDEAAVPVKESVRGLCEFFGFDPLFVANEGKLVMIVPADEAEAVLSMMRKHPLGKQASGIGRITAEHPGKVVMNTIPGGKRIVGMLAGEQLPRIC
jgi:hydrogenase expression/formation protein HypE